MVTSLFSSAAHFLISLTDPMSLVVILWSSSIKNTYKTLLTRGQKGCFIYCEDKNLAEYIRALISQG